MKLENIIKNLAKEGFNISKGEFNFIACYMCEGTALIDVVEGEVKGTSAKYNDVLTQILNNKSHIYNVDIIKGCNKKMLSPYLKMGGTE